MQNHITAAEFARRVGVDAGRVVRAIQRGDVFATAVNRDPKTGRYWLLPDAAAQEWATNYDSIKADNMARKSQPTAPRKAGRPPKEKALPMPLPPADPNVAALSTLKRQRAEVALRAEATKLKMMLGDLVSRAEVEAAQFEAAKQIRLAFESIPDRIIDAIVAAADRAQAHAILSTEIHLQLKRVADALEANAPADAS